MGMFDFVTDAKFRSSLEADYAELKQCMQVYAWKAAQVLAGSLIEALLTDALITQGYKKQDPLTMDLAKIITTCQDEQIISQTAAELSSVVRKYRNLIHPGRSIRLDQMASEKQAKVAETLVDIITEEVANQRRATYGYTAEQIIAKILSDSSVGFVLEHILRETREQELSRLLIEVLPATRFDSVLGRSARSLTDDEISALRQCFRIALTMVSDSVKRQASKRYIWLLKEEIGLKIDAYETTFFLATDAEYLDSGDVRMIVRRLVGRLNKEPSMDILAVVSGIGAFISASDVEGLVDGLVKAMVNVSGPWDHDRSQAATAAVKSEFYSVPSSLNSEFKERLDAWVTLFEERNEEEKAAKVRQVRACIDDEIPF